MIALAFVLLAQATMPSPAPVTGVRTPEEIFEQRCAKCHGSDGKAQTKKGRELKAKDFTKPKFQQHTTDKEIVDAITLRFSPAAAAWALQRYGSRARQLQDGRVDVSIESAGTGYAVQLALSLAGEAEIAGPPQAREALRDEVERALQRSQEIT